MKKPMFAHHVDEQQIHGLWASELEALSTFNAEQHRGLLHDPTWMEAMAELQARFNEAAQTEGV